MTERASHGSYVAGILPFLRYGNVDKVPGFDWPGPIKTQVVNLGPIAPHLRVEIPEHTDFPELAVQILNHFLIHESDQQIPHLELQHSLPLRQQSLSDVHSVHFTWLS